MDDLYDALAQKKVTVSWGVNRERVMIASLLICISGLLAIVTYSLYQKGCYMYMFVSGGIILLGLLAILYLLFSQVKFVLDHSGLTFTHKVFFFTYEKFIPLEDIEGFDVLNPKETVHSEMYNGILSDVRMIVNVKNSPKPLKIKFPSGRTRELWAECTCFLQEARGQKCDTGEIVDKIIKGNVIVSWRLTELVSVTEQPADSAWKKLDSSIPRELEICQYGNISWKQLGLAALGTFVLAAVFFFDHENERRPRYGFLTFLMFGVLIYRMYIKFVKTSCTLTRNELCVKKSIWGIPLMGSEKYALAGTEKLTLYSNPSEKEALSLKFETANGKVLGAWELQESDARWIAGIYCNWAKTSEF